MEMCIRDRETIAHNIACFKKQMSRFITFEGENAALMVDNGDWLLDLNYIDFLRSVGVYFSVNKMLTAECYKSRMEKGLTFLEFNYMLMQMCIRDSSHAVRIVGDCAAEICRQTFACRNEFTVFIIEKQFIRDFRVLGNLNFQSVGRNGIAKINSGISRFIFARFVD